MPTTDTRAALEAGASALRALAERDEEQGYAYAARANRDDADTLDALAARSAPEERGEGEQRCIAHAAYMAEGDCVICDKELAEERAEAAEARAARAAEENGLLREAAALLDRVEIRSGLETFDGSIAGGPPMDVDLFLPGPKYHEWEAEVRANRTVRRRRALTEGADR